MLTSLALIFLIGMLMGSIFKKLKLPSLLGMLLTGIVLGPHVLNLLDGKILDISADLRKLALIIILARAGLSLDVKDLINVGRPAFLMCFLPACFEIIGMILLAPRLLNVSILDAAIMGAVVGAVSPAVVVPKMINLMENNYGTNKSIPQLILAGASVDDVFVIVMFTSFTGLAQGETISASSFLQIPISIILGLIGGLIVGLIIIELLKRFHMRDSNKVIVIMGIAFLLVAAEDILKGIVPFSGLLAVMSLGILIQKKNNVLAGRISSKFSKLWVAAELILFVLVGAAVDIEYASKAGVSSVILIFGVLLFRMMGVYICLTVGVLEQKALFPTLIASYTASYTSHMLGLEKFTVNLVDKVNLDWMMFVKLALLGVIFGVAGGLFADLLKVTKDLFKKMFKTPITKIFLIGIIISIFSLLLHMGRYSGLGTNLISESFNGKIYSYDFLLKAIFTAVTLSAGFQGGEVTPIFSIGASLGAILATLMGLPISFVAALGYAGVFASATNTLIAPMFIGAEVFGFQYMPYFFVICMLSYIFNGNRTIYSLQKK